MSALLLQLLACPECRGAVSPSAEHMLACSGCGATYALDRGIPSLLPRTEVDGQEEWNEQQERARTCYEHADRDAKAYFDSVASEFGAFCDVSGRVLDVGCGIDGAPAYVSLEGDVTYVGLEPMLPRRAPPFPFVQGVAERLPFADATFDWALSATSFDHFPQPETALAEIGRVLKHGGRFGVWLGIVDPDYLRRMHAEQFKVPSPRDGENRAMLLQLVRDREIGRVASLGWRYGIAAPLARLRGALMRRFREQQLLDDVFADRAAHHHRFYRAEEFEELLSRAGFEILKRRRVADNAHGHSLFVVAALARA